MSLRQYQSIRVSRDINPVIVKGLQGVILDVLDHDTYLVEFVKSDGTTYEYDGEAVFELKESDIVAIE
jgi:hypothetical protein